MERTWEISDADGSNKRAITADIRRIDPVETECGRTVEPQNFFATAERAAEFTGNRLHRFGCKHCGLA